jgi:hypothetical protein
LLNPNGSSRAEGIRGDRQMQLATGANHDLDSSNVLYDDDFEIDEESKNDEDDQ